MAKGQAAATNFILLILEQVTLAQEPPQVKSGVNLAIK